MGLFHKRPLALAALLFILSVAFAFFSRANLWFLAIVFVVFSVLIGAALLRNNKSAIPVLIIIFIAICAGFTRSYLYRIGHEAIITENLNKTKTVEMTINSRQFSAVYITMYEATVTKINGQSTNTDVIFRVPYEDGLRAGTQIVAHVTLSDFSHEDATISEKLYYNAKGISLIADEIDDREYEIVSKSSDTNRFKITMNKLRTKLTTSLNKNLPEKNGLPAAVFLGDRSGLKDEDKMHFKNTGTFHLLALSGMHLSVLAGILDFIMRILSVKKGKRILIASLVILFYIALTGFALSVVRSAIMLMMSYLAYFVRRDNDSLTSLMIAGAGICAVSPNAISDVGLILSLATTFGIVAFYPAIESKIISARKSKFWGAIIHYILSSIGISTVAIMTSLPISWLYFGKLPILSPIGTLLLSPFVTALMMLTPLTMMFGSVPLIGKGLGHLTLWVAKGASLTASRLAAPSKIDFSLNYAFTPFFFIPFFIIILAVIFLKLKHLKYYLVSALAIMLCFCITHAIYVPTTALSTSFQCYGENEYFIVSKGGQNSVIDLSDGTYKKMSRAAATATSNGYCRIDALILTHYHIRHTSSVSRLIKNFPVGQIILSEPINQKEAEIALTIMETAKEAGINVRIYSLENGFTLFDETQVTLDRDYVTVSTHPILALDFEGEVDISYFGSSYAAWRNVTSAKENVILGTHGPIAKKEFYIPFSKCTRLISFADRSMLDLMSRNCPRPPDDCKILTNPLMIKIK